MGCVMFIAPVLILSACRRLQGIKTHQHDPKPIPLRQMLVSQIQSRLGVLSCPLRKVAMHASVMNRNSLQDPRPENVEGNFYVDHTCINCATCRWMNPDVFTIQGAQSAVTTQPQDPESRKRAIEALLCCPVSAIHAQSTEPGEVAIIRDSFPYPVEGTTGIYHCGFHDEKAIGATSYIVVRPEGNVLVDVPRYTSKLAKKLEQLGGVKYIFLTHRDDVGAHMKWAEKFNAPRIIHKDEANVNQGTDACEIQLTGEGPWHLSDDSKDIEFLWTPGHTSGSICMYHSPSKTFFTGDHLAYHPDKKRATLFKRYGWNMEKQIDSVKKMLEYDFVRVLPGHGGPLHFRDVKHRDEMIEVGIKHAYDD